MKDDLWFHACEIRRALSIDWNLDFIIDGFIIIEF